MFYGLNNSHERLLCLFMRTIILTFSGEMAGPPDYEENFGQSARNAGPTKLPGKQLRDLIQQDDITTSLVTVECADMKV